MSHDAAALRALIARWRAAADWILGSARPTDWQIGGSASLRQCADDLAALLASGVPSATAGDLLIAAFDCWRQHADICEVGDDPCAACDVGINQVRLAYKVWQNSAHQSASGVPSTPSEATHGDDS